MAFELWYEPSLNSMVAADASPSSIATSNSARIAYGWRVFEEMLEGIYLGPVIEYFGSEGYRQLRLGAHITESRGSEWSAAVGWAQDSQGRASPFVRLNKLKRL
jgi:Cellulose biosynthesis protein BcsS